MPLVMLREAVASLNLFKSYSDDPETIRSENSPNEFDRLADHFVASRGDSGRRQIWRWEEGPQNAQFLFGSSDFFQIKVKTILLKCLTLADEAELVNRGCMPKRGSLRPRMSPWSSNSIAIPFRNTRCSWLSDGLLTTKSRLTFVSSDQCEFTLGRVMMRDIYSRAKR